MKEGWYVYKPKKLIQIQQSMHTMALAGCGKQIVQVIGDSVWLTGVTNEHTVKEAKKYGKFKRRVKL